MRIRPPRAGRQHLNHLTGQGGTALNSQSLAGRLVQESRIPPAEAAAIVAQVARILEAGHAVGQVHGDIRPATIGYAPDGRIALIGAPAPRGGEALPYMSPEQIDRRRISPAGDIYSLGAVFFELLAGRPPYAGVEPERVGNLVTVPGHLDGITAAMLADDPVKRPRADEVVAVLESGVAAPPKRVVRPTGRTGPRLSPTVLGVLMLLVLPGLVFGGWGTLREADTMSTVGSAKPLAGILPTSFQLAFDLSIERDALRTDAELTEDFLQVTDRSIEAWTAEVRELDVSGDPGLRRRTERSAAALERLSDIRAAAREGDRSGKMVAVELYTNAVNGLFDLAAELPTFQDDELARQARNLELIGSVSEVLGLERRVMANALRNGRISDQGIADLGAAQDSWATHSESIYARADPGMRQRLDKISGRSFEFGSYAVSSQRAVIRVLNARDVEDVIRQLEDGADGRPVDQVWLADAATYVQDLKSVVVGSARQLADDVDRAHQDAKNQTIGWGIFTGIVLAVLVVLGVVLLRSRGRSVDA
ncbi:serine/threonine-protein kinase [Nocardioides turkmenicus]|uniref:serine/threonine-protein kinase n=1 Tax=Nocardioides turkmenicus TaxID=2711220 RepID=UPI0030B9C1A9